MMETRSRLIQEFDELTAIDAESLSERNICDVLKVKLQNVGFTVTEDRAGEQIGGTAGNLYGFLKGTLPGTPILLSAHMDTVSPGKGKKAIHKDGRITSDGTTVLGSDDIAGIVEIIEGIRQAEESGRDHRDVEVLFCVAEEMYTVGSRIFDYSKIRSKEAYVLDLSGAVGVAANQAPSLISFEIKITGKAAHAGFEPEKGIHSIRVMAQVIDVIPQGHIGTQTTCNIGTIQGGTGTNIVPETCMACGEIRSFSHEEALDCLRKINEIVQQIAEQNQAKGEVTHTVHLLAYKMDENCSCVRHFRAACEKLVLEGKLVSTFGGSDNNSFAERGIPGLVLSCGMKKAHSAQEYIEEEDLQKGADLVTELICQKEERES